MPIVYKSVPSDGNVVAHWRTKGSKNGVRVWQNEDGSYTEAGRNFKPGGRYNQSDSSGGDRVTKAESKAAAKAEAARAKNAKYNEKISKSIPYSRDDLSDYEKQQELSVMTAQLRYAKDMKEFQKAAEMNNIGEMKAALKRELRADEAKIIIGVGVAALAVGGLYLAGGKLDDNALQTIIKFVDPTGATKLAGQIGTYDNAANAANADNADNAMGNADGEEEFETPRIETPDTESKVEDFEVVLKPGAGDVVEPKQSSEKSGERMDEAMERGADIDNSVSRPTDATQQVLYRGEGNGPFDSVTVRDAEEPKTTTTSSNANTANTTPTQQNTTANTTPTQQNTTAKTTPTQQNATANKTVTLSDLDAYTRMLLGQNQAAINAYNRDIAPNIPNSGKKKKS